ncbi:hypothetical protein FA15DRAFT_665166 [Coprinopsis marcescibilis]|uniref:TIP120-domain-containing protein n=1 Tax=Coprinopsis marcescibilis TaxID=230819 RepID=A0A5C3L617_COPMA|nr:hypothetical protein FA15DRAFT_665166 [Coprinopsis marcescibilis]
MSLSSFLRLEDGADDEEKTAALTALITSAIRDSNPELSLSTIYQQVAQNNGSAYLDPLHVLPSLLKSDQPAARDLIGIIAECSSGKEAAIAAQETLERLRETVESGEEEADASTISTLIDIVDLYTTVIPRIKLRKKSALETVQPHLTELGDAIDALGHASKTEQASEIVSAVIRLVKSVCGWIRDKDGGNTDPLPTLRDLISRSITSVTPFLKTNIAQNTFEALYPRLVVRAPGSASGSAQAPSEQVLSDAWTTYQAVGATTLAIAQLNSVSSIIFLARLEPSELSEPKVLSSILPVVIASIQANNGVDHVLAFLLKVLHARKDELSTNCLVPLATVLPTLASGHPDPQTRHQAFRILGLLLSRSPSALRLQVLQDLTSNSEFPQMRVAAVGLVKEAILDALAQKESQNVFASPMFMRTFGPILFRPNPPDLFEASLSIKDFEESQESRRLAECLSLYYVLLVRDEKNLTGIRDSDVLKTVGKNLLTPLRAQLGVWEEEANSSDHLHDLMPLVSLQLGLDRVYAAKRSLFDR